MQTLNHLIENIKDWSGRIREQDSDFFNNLSQQHLPNYLWIGCSDSRVPASQIVKVRITNFNESIPVYEAAISAFV